MSRIAPSGFPRLSILFASLAIGPALSGCSNVPKLAQFLFVKPNYQVVQGGAVDLSQGYIARATELEADKRFDEASIWWARAVGAAPKRADAHHGLGLCLAQAGRIKEGTVALREAAALAPNNARILNNLGQALKMQGDRAEAVALFRAALKADPGHAQARYNLASLEDPGMSLAVASTPAPTAPAAPSKEPGAMAVLQPTATMAAATPTASLAVEREQVSAAAMSSATQAKPESKIIVTAMTSEALQGKVPAASAMSLNLASLTVEVFNGNGIRGAAKGLSTALAKHGVQAHRLANATRYNTVNTRIVYMPGKAAEARELAALLPTHVEVLEANATQRAKMRADVRIVLGRNLPLQSKPTSAPMMG